VALGGTYTVKKDCVQEENECEGILVALGGTYMDKVMDVLLVHFQPNCLGNRKNKNNTTSLSYNQCCGSGMFIPDPGS
jgi:hypothetical protein